MVMFKKDGFKNLLLNEVDKEKTTLWKIIRNHIAQPIIDNSKLPLSEAYGLLDSYDERTIDLLLGSLGKELEKVDLNKYIVCLDEKEDNYERNI